jgi:hypothetical protein
MVAFYVSKQLLDSAIIVMREVLDVKPEERMLIITNPTPDVYSISQALFLAAKKFEAMPTLAVQSVKGSFDYAEPAIIGALKTAPEIVLSISAQRLGKDKEALANPYKASDGKFYHHIFDFLLYGEKKIRAFWTPTITTKIFVKTVPINYAELRARCGRILQVMTGAKEIHIKTELGTDLSIGVEGRKPFVDDGDFRVPGRGGNLPAGEVFISPQLGSSNGTLVFDGSIGLDKPLIIKQPITLKVKNGFVTHIEGGYEARILEGFLRKAEQAPFKLAKEGKLEKNKASEYAANARNLGEFGIGLNPQAEIIGNVLQDEKVLGTAHVALGENYDQDAPALIHCDGIIKKPTITINGKTIMENGQLL